jgi:tetratricopeptide (TPR) repeat protein
VRSLAVPNDPLPNKRALEMLERAVGLDAGYARVWSQLALRYHYDFSYSDGGQAAIDREEEALARALELDPNQLDAGEQQVVLMSDLGRFGEALRVADGLVERHPQSASAYFARSYVRRYGDLSEGAISDCDRALELDPTSSVFRSCGNNFLYDGTYDRAFLFYDLDSDSTYSHIMKGHVYLSSGDVDAAIESWSHVAAGQRFEFFGEAVRTCAAGDFNDGDVEAFLESMAPIADGEVQYSGARILAFCGAGEAGLGMVRVAIERNFCSGTGLAGERIWDSYRALPEFIEAQRLAQECHDRFVRAAG